MSQGCLLVDAGHLSSKGDLARHGRRSVNACYVRTVTHLWSVSSVVYLTRTVRLVAGARVDVHWTGPTAAIVATATASAGRWKRWKWRNFRISVVIPLRLSSSIQC